MRINRSSSVQFGEFVRDQTRRPGFLVSQWLGLLASKLLGLAPTAAWTLVAMLLGLVIGIASIILPPSGVFGIVAVAGLFLLWAMPDLTTMPDRALRVTFTVVLFCMVCVPNYYALQLPALPWISVRRLALFAMFVPLAMMIGGSSKFRSAIINKLKANALIAFCAIGFICWTFVSMVFTIDLE